MKSNILEDNLKVYSRIPYQWHGEVEVEYEDENKEIQTKTERVIWVNYSKKTDSHYEDGWRDVEKPEISAMQKLGELYFDEGNDVVTYHILTKEAEEREAELIQEASYSKKVILEKLMEKEVIAKIQLLEGEDALEVKDAYPYWTTDMVLATKDKVQSLSPDSSEMWLWETITGHTTQEDWMPKDTPALFKRVGFDDEILVWVQPTGAHDAYNIGDKVKYPTAEDDIWESTVDGNIYAPGVVEGQWTKL